MPIARFQMPDGRIGRFEVPDGTTPEQAQALIQQSLGQAGGSSASAPSSPPDPNLNPTTSFKDNLLAGMGKAFVDLGRGARQMYAKAADYVAPIAPTMSDLVTGQNPSRSAAIEREVAESRRLDAPLMKTGGGITGNIAGYAVPAVVAAPLAGGASVAGAAGTGALFGALQPTVGDESRAQNTVIGGITGGVVQKGANVVAPWLANLLPKAAASGAGKAAANAGTDQAAADAAAAGYKLPPTTANPTPTNKLLEGFSGKVQMQQAASQANQPVTNGLATQALGLPPGTKLDSGVLDAVRAQAGKAYQAIKDYGAQFNNFKLKTDPQFSQDIGAIGNDFSAAAKEFPDLLKNDAVDSLKTALNTPSMSPAAALELTKKLRFDASQNFRAFDDPAKLALAQAQRAGADAIEGLLERSLPANMVNDFRAARQTYAKTYDIQSALNDTTGNIDAGILGRVYAKAMKNGGSPMSGELQQIAQFGSTFPKAAQLPEKMGSTPGVSPLDFVAAALTKGALGDWVTPAVAMAARPTVRKAMLSDLYQTKMLTPNYDPSLATKALGTVGGSAPAQYTLKNLLAPGAVAYGIQQ